MRIRGSTFLVTGGSSGLGAATVQALIGAGANVVAADLQPTTLATRFVRTDVTDEASVAGVIERAITEYGALHGLVSCAGTASSGLVLGSVHSAAGSVFEVNALGTLRVARLTAHAMLQNQPSPTGERGVIVNVASIAAYEGQAGQVAYASSKGAVVAMTLPLARELAEQGIRVVAIAPGIFETPMVQSLPQAIHHSLARELVFPKRFGKPAEFAALAMHVITNEMLNGTTIRLDGGVRLGLL